MRWPQAANRHVTAILLLMAVLSACGPAGFYDQAYKRLLSYVPNAIRTTCERGEYSFVGIPGHPPRGELASAYCSQRGPINFTLYETKEAMDRVYERTVGLPSQDVLGDCAHLSDAQTVWRGRSLVGEQEYAVEGKPRGRVFCEVVPGPGGYMEIAWTNELTWVLGSAQVCCLNGFDRASELNRFHNFYDWWEGLVGAERSALD